MKINMAVILTIMLVMFLVLLGWMWTSLGSIKKKTKIICIIIGLVVTYVLTFIIYNISKIGIEYESKEVMHQIRNIFVLLFTIVNGYVLLPYVFRKLEQINNDNLSKDKLIKSIIILLIMIVILFIFESIYLGSRQVAILKMSHWGRFCLGQNVPLGTHL